MTINQISKSIFVAFLAISARTWGGDLSTYRTFQFGSDLASIAKRAGGDGAQTRVVHARPILIQELTWRPQPIASPSQPEAAKILVFSFYDGLLFQITVDYDRYEIDGLTSDDLIDAISKDYGVATKPTAVTYASPAIYSDHEEVLAQWQDSRYRFDLVRFSYGRDFKLVGVQKALEARAQAATIEAVRLDAQDAPQREAARIAGESEAERIRLEKARTANKAKFKP
jgi:hypothetical protein